VVNENNPLLATMSARSAPLNDVFSLLDPADLAFLAGILGVPARTAEGGESTATSAGDAEELLRELRYAGSSDIMYAARRAMGSEPGVSFEEVVLDVARTLGVSDPRRAMNDGQAAGRAAGSGGAPVDRSRALVEHVAAEHAAATFAKLSREEQQKILEDLGVEREKAAAFLARSAGVFALPALIQAFNFFVVQGLIKTILFGSIAKFIGARLASQLFTFLAGRMPWWVGWIGPAAWTASIGWTAIDLQGPAYPKTVPAVLYLGLCSLRERNAPAAPAPDAPAPDAPAPDPATPDPASP